MAKKVDLHVKRGISFAELGALLGARELLARGLTPAVRYHGAGCHLAKAKVAGLHAFNMNIPHIKNGECGSIECIGGTMGNILGLPLLHPFGDGEPKGHTLEGFVRSGAIRFHPGSWGARGPMYDLFFPPDGYEWDAIKPSHAVQAIDNWLRTGKPLWKKIMGKGWKKATR